MIEFEKDKLLKDYSTFGIGGPARYFITVESIESLQKSLSYCSKHEIPYFILGKGSNCLFDNRGFNGLVIQNKITFIETPQPGHYYVGAGTSFSRLGALTARKGWTGLEFASGIPGTVGGAVFMNAGANGTETCETLASVDFVDTKGELHHYPKDALNFSYRASTFHEKPGAIAAATFHLAPSEEAREKQIQIITYRKSTQPYGEKSAGCVFRNPPNHSAGALIDQCQLKGMQIGGAQVSSLHGNFIVNKENASSDDVRALMALVKEKIQKQTGLELIDEVRYIPYE